MHKNKPIYLQIFTSKSGSSLHKNCNQSTTLLVPTHASFNLVFHINQCKIYKSVSIHITTKMKTLNVALVFVLIIAVALSAEIKGFEEAKLEKEKEWAAIKDIKKNELLEENNTLDGVKKEDIKSDGAKISKDELMKTEKRTEIKGIEKIETQKGGEKKPQEYKVDEVGEDYGGVSITVYVLFVFII